MYRPADPVRAVPDSAKKKWQHVADFCSVYGIAAAGRLGVEGEFGLYLNIHRVEIRRARPVMIGIKNALSGPTPELFQSIAESEDEAAAMYAIWKSRSDFFERNGQQ